MNLLERFLLTLYKALQYWLYCLFKDSDEYVLIDFLLFSKYGRVFRSFNSSMLTFNQHQLRPLREQSVERIAQRFVPHYTFVTCIVWSPLRMFRSLKLLPFRSWQSLSLHQPLAGPCSSASVLQLQNSQHSVNTERGIGNKNPYFERRLNFRTFVFRT